MKTLTQTERGGGGGIGPEATATSRAPGCRCNSPTDLDARISRVHGVCLTNFVTNRRGPGDTIDSSAAS